MFRKKQTSVRSPETDHPFLRLNEVPLERKKRFGRQVRRLLVAENQADGPVEKSAACLDRLFTTYFNVNDFDSPESTLKYGGVHISSLYDSTFPQIMIGLSKHYGDEPHKRRPFVRFDFYEKPGTNSWVDFVGAEEGTGYFVQFGVSRGSTTLGDRKPLTELPSELQVQIAETLGEITSYLLDPERQSEIKISADSTVDYLTGHDRPRRRQN